MFQFALSKKKNLEIDHLYKELLEYFLNNALLKLINIIINE